MEKKDEVKKETRVLEKTLQDLARRRTAPVFVFVILLVLYFAASITVSLTAGSQKIVMFGDNAISVYTFAGIFSSVANLCIILMAVFCGKLGFIASVGVMLIQLPMILVGIFARGNLTSLPGIFGNILTIIAIIAIYRDNRKIDDYQKKLREHATTDILTGLPNGFAGTELVNELLKRGKPFAACTIDVNNFKSINDTMGFDIGNKVLIELATRWRKIVDEGPFGTMNFLSRINGDEFSLFIWDFDSEDTVGETIRLYRSALEEKIHVEGYDIFIDASFGYAICPTDADDRDSVISNSVAAMKEIKRINSSEHVLRFTEDLLKNRNTLVIDNKVRKALENDRFYFNLQPQYDMSHKLRGFEALARLKDEDGSSIPPDDFIPAAERIGAIDGIDFMIYRKASSFFGELIRKTGADITLSINVSVKHLMKSVFIDEIRDLLKESGIPARQLEIEITESIWIESPEKAAERLKKIKNMGIRIAIDDFGTGYSSLSYLNSFPSDILKIDKSFIDQMNTGDSSKKYVEAIISLAHVMDFEVIAEGVEEPDQLETLRSINCDYIQGFIWGKPLPQEEAERLVTGAG
ncbi:MAG: EAL domain-containing protein [Lachnospiraceae bacterium]|nr:EAL domain-containing protein [Lachnospiraceae bacterium]